MTNDFEFSGKHLHEWISCLSHVVSDAALDCTLWHDGVIPHFRSRLSRFNWFFSFLFEYSPKYYLIIPSCNQNYPVFEWNGTWLMQDTVRQLAQLLFNPFSKTHFRPKICLPKTRRKPHTHERILPMPIHQHWCVPLCSILSFRSWEYYSNV